MPFDSTEVKHVELRRLRDRLLDRSTWPDGFQWYFPSCRRCAMALLVGEDDRDDDEVIVVKTMKILNISPDTVSDLFGGGPGRRHGVLNHQVTPEMIASDIDNWLMKNQ